MSTALRAVPILITPGDVIALLSAAKMDELTSIARGMTARWLREHRIPVFEPMREFDSVGWHFDADQCAADRWRFIHP